MANPSGLDVASGGQLLNVAGATGDLGLDVGSGGEVLRTVQSTLVPTGTYTAAGGVTFGGAAATSLHSVVRSFGGGGTVTFSGVAATGFHVGTHSYTGSGTRTFSGTAVTALGGNRYVGGGTLTFRGAAFTSFRQSVRSYTGSGTRTFSGTAVSNLSHTHTYSGGGTVTFSGTAVTGRFTRISPYGFIEEFFGNTKIFNAQTIAPTGFDDETIGANALAPNIYQTMYPAGFDDETIGGNKIVQSISPFGFRDNGLPIDEQDVSWAPPDMIGWPTLVNSYQVIAPAPVVEEYIGENWLLDRAVLVGVGL